jgi:hypothetical protein
LLVVALATMATAAPASVAAAAGHYVGTLDDGGTWVADVPAHWNGILIIYSHGFGPPIAMNAPSPSTRDALLARGYALAGSSYGATDSWWALKSAVRDQFETVEDVTNEVLPEPPRLVLALGTSMGGLVSSLEAEAGGPIDGALSTCGIVAGAIDLNNYQLNATYAIARLLAPDEDIKLVNFASPGEGFESGGALTDVAQEAQQTPEGRARLALALAFLNAPAEVTGQPTPEIKDARAYQAAQYEAFFGAGLMNFIQFGRYWIEQSAGGNGSWTMGEDFAHLLNHSPYKQVVKEMYQIAGLDLEADLATLTADADIAADPDALESLTETSVPTGRLDVPVLTMHTTGDALVPVQHEREYGDVVRQSSDASMLRQAYVERAGHCTFTDAELVAGLEALGERVETGLWQNLARPKQLNQRARALGLGEAAFVNFQPDRLSGDPGEFDPRWNT